MDLLADQWTPYNTIEILLVSICSLLDNPGLDDPLVPEIAEIYCKDYDQYYENAKVYTARYASAEPSYEEGEDPAGEIQHSSNTVNE